MKKFLIILALSLFFCAFTACDTGSMSGILPSDGAESGEEEHTHVFDQEKTREKFLKSAATETDPAVYFYSCECGAKGEETFVFGTPLPAEPETPDPALGLVFAKNLDTTYSVIDYTGTEGEVAVPATYEGGAVTRIAPAAFQDCTQITSVTIPEGITMIGEKAFAGCTSLNTVTIPASIELISADAFSDCSAIQTATLPISAVSALPKGALKTLVLNDGEAIEARSFYRCTALKSVTIPTSVKNISTEAFSGCTSLETIHIPAGVASVDYNAFSGCTSLEAIHIPASVTSVAHNAFSGCKSVSSITVDSENSTYHSIDNCLIETEEKILVLGCKNSVIPADETVTAIGACAFYGCDELKTIELPAGIESIGNSAFAECKSLSSITFPAALQSIGNSAFQKCTKLTSVKLPSLVKSVGSFAFSGCTGLTLVNISASATGVSANAFSGCTKITTASMPASMISCIPQNSLTTVEINMGSSIASGAFRDCTTLQSVIIAPTSGITTISSSAFYGCTSLSSVTLPADVSSIGYSAFGNCGSLTTIHYQGTKRQWSSVSKGGISSGVNIVCSDGTY